MVRVKTLRREAEQLVAMGIALDAEELPRAAPWPAQRLLAGCLTLPATCFSGSVLLRSPLWRFRGARHNSRGGALSPRLAGGGLHAVEDEGPQ